MIKFTTLTSTIIPLDLKDIDTDMIIPAQYLTSTSQEGYGKNLFRRLRDSDSDFPLNQEKYNAAQIIVAQKNFGCGSSREHAVWALLEYGIRVVIAPSFADIFHSNSTKNGLVLVSLPNKIINEIIQSSQSSHYIIAVNLKNQIVTLPDDTNHPFPFDPFRKDCILKGHDDLDYLLEHMEEIEEWHKKRE